MTSFGKQLLFNIIGITCLLIGVSELLAQNSNILTFIASSVLLLSGVGLIARWQWANTVFFSIAAWYIFQDIFFIKISSNLRLSSEQIILLPMVILFRAIQALFFSLSAVMLWSVTKKGSKNEK